MTKIGLKPLALMCVLFLGVGVAWAQDYSFTYTCDNQGKVIDPDSLGYFITVLRNTGAQADSYRVIMDKDLPGIWQSIACFPWGCFFDSADVIMAPAQLETLTVDIIPIDTSDVATGVGTVTVRVRSLTDPAQAVAIPLTAITNVGVDVLVVDDDGTEDYEVYYQAALDSTDWTHGTLHNATTIIGSEELAPFQAVVWFTGEATPVLTHEDREALTAYLNGGGRLFISGQNIAYALCDSASGESDSSTIIWFESIFSAAYGGEYASTLMLNGIAGNSISDGCTLNISGGAGANNQTSPDIVEPIFGQTYFAYPVFHYTDFYDWPDMGAFTVSTGMYRVVYLAFGFEAIDNATDQALLMERIMNYFEGPTPVESRAGLVSKPEDSFLSPSYPNPFNATTSFALYVPGENPKPVSVKIYNVLGQEVRTLMAGVLRPGRHIVVWDGKDDLGRDLASGVYFCQLQVGEFSQTRKLVLAR